METPLTMPSDAPKHVDTSKGQTSSGAAVMAQAVSYLESFQPLSHICEAWCGIHVKPDDPAKQNIAYHYCSMIDEDRRQCLIYDRNAPNAKLIGVEYIISEKLFMTLPMDERKFWHSHKYECESGLLVQISKAGVPEMVVAAAEKAPLEILVNTYGKTWQLWPLDEHGCCSSHVPMGPPQLLMSFTADHQVHQAKVAERDKEMNISTATKRKERDGVIVGHPVAPGADQWCSGKVWQICANCHQKKH
ncbi:hypothetical protein DFQ26_005307 [Actinomortierella ambigua]|nr:hypothetical protein DFQ26_005307 [Actinomortierella ambigua]